MTTRAIQCPGCRAADMSAPDPHGVHTCTYCGLRYQAPAINVQAPSVVYVEAARPTNTAAIAIGVSAALVLVIGAVVALLVVGGDEGGSVSEPAASPRARSASQRPSTSSAEATEVRARPASVEVGPAPSREVEAEIAATAEFELHGTRSGLQPTFYVLGYVTNTSPFPIRKPKLTVVLLDEGGNEVGTSNGFGEDDVVEPGDKTPASVLVKDPPEHASFSVEVSPHRSTFALKEVSGLEVEAGEPTRASFGNSLDIAGRVHHRGDEPAKFVKVQVLAFDANDKLLGIHSSYADAERLEPGASARFSTRSMRFETDPARFELSASGRVAD
jgi:hypothetical protein